MGERELPDPAFDRWMQALGARHLANLRTQEITRALRALSSIYVERRGVRRGAALETAGKRAAFALFYGPLHYLVARRVLAETGAGDDGPGRILDLGCGTGACGAAWASADGRRRVLGIDRHGWAVEEANWTYSILGVNGVARRSDVARFVPMARHRAIVLGYTANEVDDASRSVLLERLITAHSEGSRVLVIEPIARPAGTWWDRWAEAFRAHGGREDMWRFDQALPDRVRLFDRAAGLDHRVLTARSLYLG